MDKITPKFWILTLMIFGAAFVRLIPHPPNFAPIAAMALFGGAYFNKKWAAFIVPIAAMFITDLILGFHETMWAVYLSFALIVVIGMLMIKQKKVSNILFASVTSSVVLFYRYKFRCLAYLHHFMQRQVLDLLLAIPQPFHSFIKHY